MSLVAVLSIWNVRHWKAEDRRLVCSINYKSGTFIPSLHTFNADHCDPSSIPSSPSPFCAHNDKRIRLQPAPSFHIVSIAKILSGGVASMIASSEWISTRSALRSALFSATAPSPVASTRVFSETNNPLAQRDLERLKMWGRSASFKVNKADLSPTSREGARQMLYL